MQSFIPGSNPGHSHPAAPRPVRPAWVAAGFACIVLGTLGIVLPLLPTVDFYVMAAICFARGNPRLEARLLAHPWVGPMVRDWRAHRGVPLRAKCLATLGMALSCAVSAALLPVRTAWIPAAVCALVALYLWTRPTRRTAPAVQAATGGAEPA